MTATLGMATALLSSQNHQQSDHYTHHPVYAEDDSSSDPEWAYNENYAPGKADADDEMDFLPHMKHSKGRWKRTPPSRRTSNHDRS